MRDPLTRRAKVQLQVQLGFNLMRGGIEKCPQYKVILCVEAALRVLTRGVFRNSVCALPSSGPKPQLLAWYGVLFTPIQRSL